MYFVYLLRCNDNSLYCGFTTNVEKRVLEHNNSTKGAKYTRIKRPVKLVYFETYSDKTKALKREAEIKKLKKIEKEKIVEMAHGF